MNERIRVLAEQAGIKITPMVVDGVEYEYEDVDMDGSEDLVKFAQLIVRDCANELLKWKSEPFPLDPESAARIIQEHFRVEE